jgi:putative hydrolase of the HAD superfamily
VRGSSNKFPKVIFLDAAGTLFGIKGSVGGVYGEIAHRFGVDVSPSVLNQAFFKSFKAAGVPAFPGIDPAQVQKKEYEWWLEVATQTFKQANAFHLFADFEEFFAELYAYFATGKPWVVYPDVQAALKQWKTSGVQLGVVSNFDSRLYSVLHALNLADFFTSITISTEAGVAKPDARIFAIALEKHQCPANLAWHIGDSYEEDYQGACKAGLKGIWLRRKGD